MNAPKQAISRPAAQRQQATSVATAAPRTFPQAQRLGNRNLDRILRARLLQAKLTPVQRQPSNPPPGSGSNATPTATTTPALDPDAQEAALRGAAQALLHVDLPHVDQARQTPQENDASAQWMVLLAFGGEENLNTAFETLAPEVLRQVDADTTTDVARARRAGGTPDPVEMKTANRARFLARLRLYFNSWAAVLAHFRAIERVSDGPIDIFLHHDAAAHLRRAIAALKSKGHKLPRIGEGFSLRHLYRATDDKGNPIIQHPGMMIHATGNAFDAFAKGNPKISYSSEKAAGPERHVQDLLAVTVGPANARVNLETPARRSSNYAFVDAMGKRTAADTVAVADDSDPATVDYFRLFEQQFRQMEAGSNAFTQSLSKAHRDALLKLRGDYFTQLRGIAAERKKGSGANPTVIAGHEAQRRKLLAGIPALVMEWVAAIDAEVKHELAKHSGMDKLRSPSLIALDLRGKQAELGRITAEEQRAKATIGTAQSGRDAASAALNRARARVRASADALAAAQSAPRVTRRQSSGDWNPSGSTITNVDEARKAAAQAGEALKTAKQGVLDSMDALEKAITAELETRKAMGATTGARDALKAELAKSDLPALHDSWAWIDRLRELRDALTKPDLATDTGVKAYERLTTGNLSELGSDFPVDNPPLVRLLDTGFFNPTGDFDLAFFEEVAHSGFVPGATWTFGSVDSMHFELAEGRHSLSSPGKR